MSSIALRFLILLCVVLAGCGSSDADGVLNADSAMQVGNGQAVKFDSEQISINMEQVECGVQNELFGEITPSASRKIAPLTDRARQLGFTDDVSIDESGHSKPYTQVRGTFPLEIRQVVNIKDDEKGAKRVEAWAGLRIDHYCFPAALQIMGIRRGAQTELAPAAFEYVRAEEGWKLAQILHQ